MILLKIQICIKRSSIRGNIKINIALRSVNSEVSQPHSACFLSHKREQVTNSFSSKILRAQNDPKTIRLLNACMCVRARVRVCDKKTLRSLASDN